MLTWMGFLGQELPGSIICDECTCSHMPMYNRRCTYLAYTCSYTHRWVHATAGLMPTEAFLQSAVGCCPEMVQLGAKGWRPRHKIPACAVLWCWAVGPARAGCSLSVPSPLEAWGDIPTVLSGEVSLALARCPSAVVSPGSTSTGY